MLFARWRLGLRDGLGRRHPGRRAKIVRGGEVLRAFHAIKMVSAYLYAKR